MLESILSQPNSPLWYWYVMFIFGPAFVLGWWGLLGMLLLHLIIFASLYTSYRKRQAGKTQPLWRRLLSLLGLIILTNILSGVLVYGGLWLYGGVVSLLS
ncbi:hypothetical protein ACVRZR_02365 [Streptococcus entericus]|uniref:hypothetical protein n=1 Tax=Streptococcus entericus TaxID=155680 RepID=UPI00036B4DA6|nr:hypothetical protein [Streptococcus entericus]